MNLYLDMKTILITLVIGHLFTVILISSYWKNHTRDASLNTFFLAKCIQAIAWLLLTIRGGVSDIFTISIANSLLFTGSSLEAIALLKLVGHYKQFTKNFYTSFIFFYIISFHLVLFFYNHENIRIALASFCTSVIVLLPAHRLMRMEKASLLKKIMGILYYFVGLTFFLRGVASVSFEQEMGLFTPGFIQSISFLSLFLVMILGNTGFILLLKERADDELIQMAYYDELTQILNRRTFITRAKQMLAQCIKEETNISFILFDIDYFKHFNDKYGHDAGDKILQDLAQRIQQHLGSNDLIGRYGGDEFAILLTKRNRLETAKKIEEITALIAESKIAGINEKYTISLGVITLVPEKQTALEDLYICTDKALYAAKHSGRNCYCFGEWK